MNIEPNNWLTKKIVAFLARVTPRCHDMTRLISQSLDRSLPRGTRWKMRLHFLLCTWCRRYRVQLRLLRRAFAKLGDDTPAPRGLSAEARARLRDSLSGES